MSYNITILRRKDTAGGDYDPYLNTAVDCSYDVISNYECVTTALLSTKQLNDMQQSDRFELTKKYRGFKLTLDNTLSDIQRGDYVGYQIQDADGAWHIYFWKITSIDISELFKGCCTMFIIGEYMQGRECTSMAPLCGKADYVIG